MIALTIILTIYIILITWICVVQYRRSSNLEKIADNLVQNMLEISNILSSSKELLSNDRIAVAFSNDDEIGDFFQNLKDIQSLLDNFIVSQNSDAKKS